MPKPKKADKALTEDHRNIEDNTRLNPPAQQEEVYIPFMTELERLLSDSTNTTGSRIARMVAPPPVEVLESKLNGASRQGDTVTLNIKLRGRAHPKVIIETTNIIRDGAPTRSYDNLDLVLPENLRDTEYTNWEAFIEGWLAPTATSICETSRRNLKVVYHK
jgi:hypothetical protein